jgi:predicted amidohydrolase
MNTEKVKIAAVQTKTVTGPGCDEANIAYACNAMDVAAANGADIICFPETFPGPLKAPLTWDPFEAMSDKARRTGRYIVYGATVDAPDRPGCRYISSFLLGPDGKPIGRYDRTSPHALGAWLYKGGRYLDINYVPGDRLPVFETELGAIGMLVCSEVYLPELSRALAVQGAEIVFIPAGTNRSAARTRIWSLLMRARAVENLMYTVTCNNIADIPGLDAQDGGLAMIVSPEDEVVESCEEGIIYAEADLARLRYLRERDDNWESIAERPEIKTKPGIFRTWRRPELWKELI